MTQMLNRKGRFAVVGLALAASLATVPAVAGPIPLDPSLTKAGSNAVEEVRCTGCYVAGGIAAGVIAGAAIANANRGYYNDPPPRAYYEPAPRYGYSGYDRGYYARPGYGPGYGYYQPERSYGSRYND